jgi:hypothetical protein
MSVKRVYERHLTLEAGNAINVGSDESPMCFAIDFPPEGLIKKLIVRQVGGAPVAFTANLYNDLVCGISEVGEGSSEVPSTKSKDLAKVIPTQNGTAGNTMEFFSESGYAFRNQRGNWTVPERKIYLEINPTSPSGDTTWEVAIAILPAITN